VPSDLPDLGNARQRRDQLRRSTRVVASNDEPWTQRRGRPALNSGAGRPLRLVWRYPSQSGLDSVPLTPSERRLGRLGQSRRRGEGVEGPPSSGVASSRSTSSARSNSSRASQARLRPASVRGHKLLRHAVWPAIVSVDFACWILAGRKSPLVHMRKRSRFPVQESERLAWWRIPTVEPMAFGFRESYPTSGC
jgi:hypothetical protein